MTTDARKKAKAIANRCDCDHDDCGDDYCKVLAHAIEAALDEVHEDVVSWKADCEATHEQYEAAMLELEKEQEARKRAEDELSGMYEPASVCTHSRGFDIYNRSGYLIGVYDNGKVVFTATKKGEDGKRVASWTADVRDDEEEPFWPKVIQNERQAREDADLLVWGLSRNLNDKGEPYIGRSTHEWFFRNERGQGCSLGNGPVPVLTDEARDALRRAKEEN